MPWRAAARINISKKEELILNQLSNGTHTPLHLKLRSQIVLSASQGKSNNAIRIEMGLLHHTVKRWRDRYLNASEEIKRTEAETPHKLRKMIEETLSDEQRPGSPPKFTDEQVAAIIAVSCEDPAIFDLPFSHWTPELLQIEVVKMGIVESISVRQVGRFLKRERFTTSSKPNMAESQYR